MPLEIDERKRWLQKNAVERKQRRDRFIKIIKDHKINFNELGFLNLSEDTFSKYMKRGVSVNAVTPGKNTMIKLEHYVLNRKVLQNG